MTTLQRPLATAAALIGGVLSAVIIACAGDSAARVTQRANFSSAIPASAAATPSVSPEALFFDAIFTHARAAGPGPDHVGHQQIASGVLRDASGHNVGGFAFKCTWTRMLAAGDALEACSGFGRTPDGRLTVGGRSRESDPTHQWKIRGGTGAYRASTGTVLVRDLGTAESLIRVTIRTRRDVAARSGAIPRPAANAPFVGRADHICARASHRLGGLPRFPFANFDPLHPDPRVLPRVGAFFTGPGNPRPILHALQVRLQGLGSPAANRRAWQRTLRARDNELAAIRAQDKAALADNVPAFVKTVRASTGAYRQVAITTTVFGVTSCVI